ncbi:MAG TPA: type II toxin-antitoxin system RelB/DinJ family antitoxin [Verrucomicrobiae bacterium]|nr:type II toxin-antitoxin system RelB/DinJ family antitoxin [Verrucomicrobiae bacterium]
MRTIEALLSKLYRIDRELVKKAEQVGTEIGLSSSQMISLFFAQMVKLRALPIRPSEFPVLEEYGATLADAEVAEDKALAEIQAARKAGKVFEFKGKLA